MDTTKLGYGGLQDHSVKPDLHDKLQEKKETSYGRDTCRLQEITQFISHLHV